MTDEEFALEYELDLALKGGELKKCFQCGTQTHRPECPHCTIDGKPMQLTGDPVIDDAFARMEAGEDVGDLETLLRSGSWASVEPTLEAES